MGGQANTPGSQPNNVQVTTTNQGRNITNSQYAAFDDVLFGASGFTFSLNSSGNNSHDIRRKNISSNRHRWLYIKAIMLAPLMLLMMLFTTMDQHT